MSLVYNIFEHWDPEGIINSSSNPEAEFGTWIHHAIANPTVWRGDEFTKQDFIDYINHLKKYDPPKTHHPCGTATL